MARTRKRAHVHGVLAIDKPQGWTSHDVVGRLRRVFAQRQVGHSGTLDPMATGALIVLLGEATKLSRFVQESRKTYLATLELGARTSSDDADGDVLERAGVPRLSADNVRSALCSFVGEYEQVPPNVSAIKVNGKRAYQRSRDGEQVVMAPRRVRCFEAELLRFDERQIEIRAVVAAGYYVRSLGRDLASRLGTLGHLVALRRTHNAGFDEADLIAVSTLQSADDPRVFVRPLLSAWPAETRLRLGASHAEALSHGKRIAATELPDAQAERLMKGYPECAWAAVLGDGDLARLVAIVQCVEGEIRVVRGFDLEDQDSDMVGA